MNKIVKRIILLRHEERTENPEFNTDLTANGLKKSESIIDRLDKKGYEINQVYSSPYLRCLQTIQPLLININQLVNVDNSLAEWFSREHAVGRITTPRHLINEELEKYHINPRHQSILKVDDFLTAETENDLKNRIDQFIKYLVEKYSGIDETNETILIVSHLSVINQIANTFGKNRDLEDYFKMGSLIILDSLEEF